MPITDFMLCMNILIAGACWCNLFWYVYFRIIDVYMFLAEAQLSNWEVTWLWPSEVESRCGAAGAAFGGIVHFEKLQGRVCHVKGRAARVLLSFWHFLFLHFLLKFEFWSFLKFDCFNMIQLFIHLGVSFQKCLEMQVWPLPYPPCPRKTSSKRRKSTIPLHHMPLALMGSVQTDGSEMFGGFWRYQCAFHGWGL